jgi:hypothetical protein
MASINRTNNPASIPVLQVHCVFFECGTLEIFQGPKILSDLGVKACVSPGVLFAGEHAVEGHINHIFAKLGANGYTEATCIAIKQGKQAYAR